MIIRGCAICGSGKAVIAVSLAEAERAGAIDANDIVAILQSISSKNLLSDQCGHGGGHHILQLIRVQVGEDMIQGITVRASGYLEQGEQTLCRRPLLQEEFDLSPGLEPVEEDEHAGEEQTGQRVGDPLGMTRVRHWGREEGKTTKEMVDGVQENAKQGQLLLVAIGVGRLNCSSHQDTSPGLGSHR